MYKYKYSNFDELLFSQANSVYSSNKGIVKKSYNEIEVIDLIAFIENLNIDIDLSWV